MTPIEELLWRAKPVDEISHELINAARAELTQLRADLATAIHNHDDRVKRLNDAVPCGVMRDGYAMALVRLEDAHAAYTLVQTLEASSAYHAERAQTLRAEKDVLHSQINTMQGRIANARMHLG